MKLSGLTWRSCDQAGRSTRYPAAIETPAEQIHIEDSYGLAWTKSNNGIHNMQNSQLIRT